MMELAGILLLLGMGLSIALVKAWRMVEHMSDPR